MRRTVVVLQAAIVMTLVGVMMLLLAGGGVDRRPAPYRPATDQEQQQYEVDRLAELLLEQQQRAQLQTPPPARGY